MENNLIKNNKTVLKLENITKNFRGVKALDNVSFDLSIGEIHAIVGENGAGKSTLFKIISGAVSKDSGKILLNDLETDIKSTQHALSLGISGVYQELVVLEDLDVAANIFLGNEGVKNILGYLNRKRLAQEAKYILKELNCDIDPQTIVGKLSVAEKQMVEIAKALSRKSKILLLDEPNASLTPKETASLFRILKQLKKNHVSIILISHRLEDVFEISDRITVLRDGKNTGNLITRDTNEDEIIKLMVGREIKDIHVNELKENSPNILEIKNLNRRGVLKNITFNLREGEILGIYGLVGSGRTELARVIFGLDKKDSGDIYLWNHSIKINSPLQAVNNGIGLIPEDRKLQGLFLEFSIKNNISIVKLKELVLAGFIKHRDEELLVSEYISKLSIKASSKEQAACDLSGGNQQKVVISKWLANKPKILIMDEPTKGVDVSTKSEIYKIMNTLIEDGVSIIMISSELPEILKMSNRILVMNKGRVSGLVEHTEATEEKLISLAVKGD